MTESFRRWGLLATLLLILLAGAGAAAAYVQTGLYGVNVLWQRGGGIWVPVPPDSPRLSPSMRLALQDPPPAVQPGPLEWQAVADGFEAAELPVLAGGAEVDRLLLARVDPARYRFVARNAPAGNRRLADWMADPGTLLVIDGSYYGHRGTPVTPFVSDGAPLGPVQYAATHGAFVASDAFTGIRDLHDGNWHAALAGARDAMVSYPMLLAADGSSRAERSRWLANRSFVAQDAAGRIVLGTTREAFFSLDRLAGFLRAAPLGLTLALNLDGGPVACQGIALSSFQRRFCGRWELAEHESQTELLTYRWGDIGNVGLPVVLAVVRR